MFARLPMHLDVATRIYLPKTLVLPIINMYDFIYGTASGRTLRSLGTACNGLMRSMLGIKRSEHTRVVDMYKLTSFDQLAERRNESLLKT
jgi:hypothetical protein